MNAIEITLNGQPVTLKRTLTAFKTIGERHGGVVPLIQAIGALNLDAFAHVISVGAEMKHAEAEKAVFENGMEGIGPDLIRYLDLLIGGDQSK